MTEVAKRKHHICIALTQQRRVRGRYVASLGADSVSVGLRQVPATSPLGQLKGTGNLLEFHTKYFAPMPLVVQGTYITYMYIYTCIYIYMCVCVCVCVYMYICIYICTLPQVSSVVI